MNSFNGYKVSLIIFDVDGTLTPIEEPEVAGKGVVETLIRLNDAGLMLALCTGKPRYLLEQRFINASINLDLFWFKVASCPKADIGIASAMLNRMLTETDIVKEVVVYVGDTENDCRLARACGVHFFGVLTGETERDDFLQIGVKAENIIPSVNHLPGILGLKVTQPTNLRGG